MFTKKYISLFVSDIATAYYLTKNISYYQMLTHNFTMIYSNMDAITIYHILLQTNPCMVIVENYSKTCYTANGNTIDKINENIMFKT